MRSTSLQSDDPVTDDNNGDDSFETETVFLAFNGNKVIRLNALMNMIILNQNMKLRMF